MMTYQVHVSGKTYYTALDPRTTGLLDECGVTAEIRPRGYGVTVSMHGTLSHLWDLLDALEDVRDVLGGGGVDADAAERAALRKDCDGLRVQLDAFGSLAPR